MLRFYKQDTAPGCNGGDGISSERQVNFFAGKTLDKSVLRAPQREALDAVSRWAERSAGLLNGEFATKVHTTHACPNAFNYIAHCVYDEQG